MRITYYKFPEGTPEATLYEHGCNEEDRTVTCSVTWAKKLMKQFGGIAYTHHCERDGSLFEVTEVTLKGNNSRFQYNHHL